MTTANPETSPSLTTPRRRPWLRALVAVACVLGCAGTSRFAAAGDVIRIGELNAYKTFPAFLEPYRKGWQLALEEINAAGGVAGRRLEVVSRDDNGNPGDAVRVAEELASREHVVALFGGFASHVGLAVSDFARQRRILFLAAEPLSDKLVWQNGNRYTFRLRASTYMQTAMLVPEAVRLHRRRWALVYPNYEYGQAAAEAFKALLKARQPDVEFVAEQAPPLGKIDAGATVQALASAKPDAIFSALFATDLAKFVRAGNTRGLFRGREVFNLLGGEPEYLDPLRAETPAGWYVTGYPWRSISTPAHTRFLDAYRARWHDYPRLGSVVGYVAMHAVAAAISRAGDTQTEKLVDAMEGLDLDTPFGPIRFRAIDHQSTMGAFVGRLAQKDGRGVMVDWVYRDGAAYLPPDDVVRTLRPAH
ncbi:MAG: ABC transporter substrate-binding protein [Betaproteobacteria bacterium]|nr:ABC transporter substrate-binding protein [Betaproteobacteria bacterium]